MKKLIKYSISFCICFFILSSFLSAQNDYKNEAELIKKADQSFKKDDFVGAFRPYSQLLSLYPKNPFYNFRFGVCLMYADKRDKEKPIRYLEFAANNYKEEAEVFYYLGMAYHLNYMFSQAIKSYEKYKVNAKALELKKHDVDRRIQMCNNGIELLGNISDLFVLEKIQVRKSDFYRSYKTRELEGEFLSKPDYVKTKLDKKKDDRSFVFFSNNNQVIYFSSYGKKGETGKDIYRASKLPGGKWTAPKRLNEVINTPYDEDYPYMMPDGKTLFFCSKGHNTMGGYDIFMSSFNPASFMWSLPVNINFPFNTPFDDILFVSDSTKGYAYFSSERSSIEDQITVYKVGIGNRPEKTENLALAYKPEVEGKEADYLKAVKYIKEKAELEVNITPEKFNEDLIEKEKEREKERVEKEKLDTNKSEIIAENKINKELEARVLSDEKIIETAFEQHDKVTKQIKVLKTQKDVVTSIGNQRKKDASEKNNQAKESENEANVLKTQATQLYKEADIAYNIADNIGKQIVVKEKEAEKIINYAAEIQKSVSVNPPETSMALLNKLLKEVETADTLKDFAQLFINENQKLIAEKNTKASEYYKNAKKLEQDVAELKDEAKQYRVEAGKINDVSLQKEYIAQAEEFEKEAKNKQDESKSSLVLWEKTRNEADSIKDNSKYLDNVLADLNKQVVAAEKEESQKAQETEVVAEKIETVKETETETGKPIETQKELVEEVTKTQITAEANQYIKVLEEDNADLTKQADKALVIANQKNSLSVSKKKEAEKLMSEINVQTPESEKKAIINDADKLIEESVQLAREAVAYYDISKKYETQIQLKTNEFNEAKQDVQKIEKLVNSDNFEKANQKLDEFNQQIANKKQTQSYIDLFTAETKLIAENKQSEASSSLENAKKIEAESVVLFEKATQIKAEADKTIEPEKKEELIAQATQKENEANIKKNQSVAEFTKAKQLTNQANALQKEIDFSSSTLAQLEKTQLSPQEETKPSAVDKSKLEEQITAYKNDEIFTDDYIEKQTPQELSKEQEIAENVQKEQTAEIDTEQKVKTETEIKLIADATKYAESFKNVANEISVQAKNALILANQKSKLSEIKYQEAGKFLGSINEQTTVAEKETKTQKAKELNEESVILAREAVIAFNVSKQLDAKTQEKQAIANSANQNVEEIVSLIERNLFDEANVKTQELKAKSELIAENNISDLISTADNQTAESKQKEATDVFAKAQNLENEAFNLETEAKKIREEASSIRRVSKKRSLIAQAVKLETDANYKKQLAMENRNKGSKLQIEATALKTQIQYTTNIVREIENSPELAENEVSSIDKTKLQNQIYNYQNENVFTPDFRTEAVAIAEQEPEQIAENIEIENEQNITEKPEDVTQNEQTEVITEKPAEEQQTQISETKENVVAPQETSLVKEISDIDKAYTKTQYYTKSANLVNAEIQLIENRLPNITSQDEILENQKRISGLRNLGDSLQNLANESRAQVNLLRVTENAQLTIIDEEINTEVLVENLKFQAKENYAQAEEFKSKAENIDNNREKQAVLKEAEKFEKIADEKELEAYEVVGISNQNEFFSNKVKIEQIRTEDPKNFKINLAKSDEQDAQYYFDKATDYRNTTKGNMLVETKKTLLDEANKFESIALKKQQKVIDIYNEANPDAVVDEKFITQNTFAPKSTVSEKPQEEILVDNQQKEQVVNEEIQEEVVVPEQPKEQITEVEKPQEEILVDNQQKEQVVNEKIQDEVVVPEQPKEQITEIEKPQEVVVEVKKPQEEIAEKPKEIITETVEETKTTEASIEKRPEQSSPVKRVKTIGVYLSKNGQNEARLSAYNINNPIPENISLPTGLIYKVQIAAFRKKVPDNVFKGISPISSEKKPNSEFIRYMAGLFVQYNDAVSARNNIRKIGYKDAFVVAYFNGKRITLGEAMALINSGEAFTAPELASAINIGETANSLTQAAAYNIKAPAKTVEASELVYSVQVGVYSTPRNSAQLFNVENLFNDRMQNGYYRYFSGKYNTRNEAVPPRDNIRERGIKDAFIVTINNNKRISFAEARRIRAGMPTSSRTQLTLKSPAKTQASETPIEEAEKIQAKNIVFKVQIGAYKNEISQVQLNFFKRITKIEIESYRNSKGLVIYSVGNFNDYESAKAYKNNIVNAGVSGAFVTAFSGNTRISVGRAMEMMRE